MEYGVIEDRLAIGAWRLVHETGEVSATIFSGPRARSLAEEYAALMNVR